MRDGEPLPDQDLRSAAWGVLLAEVHAARTAPGSTDRPGCRVMTAADPRPRHRARAPPCPIWCPRICAPRHRRDRDTGRARPRRHHPRRPCSATSTWDSLDRLELLMSLEQAGIWIDDDAVEDITSVADLARAITAHLSTTRADEAPR